MIIMKEDTTKKKITDKVKIEVHPHSGKKIEISPKDNIPEDQRNKLVNGKFFIQE